MKVFYFKYEEIYEKITQIGGMTKSTERGSCEREERIITDKDMCFAMEQIKEYSGDNFIGFIECKLVCKAKMIEVQPC